MRSIVSKITLCKSSQSRPQPWNLELDQETLTKEQTPTLRSQIPRLAGENRAQQLFSYPSRCARSGMASGCCCRDHRESELPRGCRLGRQHAILRAVQEDHKPRHLRVSACAKMKVMSVTCRQNRVFFRRPSLHLQGQPQYNERRCSSNRWMKNLNGSRRSRDRPSLTTKSKNM